MSKRSKQNLSDEVSALSANNEQLTNRIEELHIKVRDLTAERDELSMKLSRTERVLEARWSTASNTPLKCVSSRPNWQARSPPSRPLSGSCSSRVASIVPGMTPTWISMTVRRPFRS